MLNEHTEKHDWHEDHIEFPKYVGCYKDKDDDVRDLSVFIGKNLNVKTLNIFVTYL